MARPKSREGRYERIALDVREDLLGWLDSQYESRRETIEEALIDLKAKKEAEHMATQTVLAEALEKFLASPDFKAGVISSTKASWGGSGYSVELYLDGHWSLAWNNQIGNLYEPEGVILKLPALDTSEMNDYLAQSDDTEEDYLSWAFYEEEEEIAKDLRECFNS